MPTQARKKPAPKTIERIKSTLIINRLQKHILATNKDDLLTQSQVTAGLGLLKKTHPDLAAQQVTGQVDTEITIKWQK